ncbi:hypothetical protein MA16_Dca001130 [Dendrobium catenatum]|uniref:Uncharacterized protein n=1 Tax=Dendrobium catenatum TaxID=906689 RepID=A0A2I0WLJ1_9ASPA|nr:hypothetical protein MA16_Dca001130 [Dendrobium catenatum]
MEAKKKMKRIYHFLLFLAERIGEPRAFAQFEFSGDKCESIDLVFMRVSKEEEEISAP